jgi:hypothetical protein
MKKIILSIALLSMALSVTAQVLPVRFDAVSANQYKYSTRTNGRPLFPASGILIYDWANRLEWKDSTMVIKYLINNTDLSTFSGDYYTKTNMQTSGQAQLHWDNLTNKPAFLTYPGAGIAVSTGSAWGTSITDNSIHWNDAYGWGDHAGLYSLLSHNHSGVYLTTETDPIFSAWLATDPVFNLTRNLGSAASADISQFVQAKDPEVKEISTNGENNIVLATQLSTKTKIFYNGSFVENTRWTGVGSTTLTLSLDTRVYDTIIITN